MKTTHSADPRADMLARFDQHVKALRELFTAHEPLGVYTGELFAHLEKACLALERTPFLGMIVKMPPPEHTEEGMKRDRDFLWWFENLSSFEVRGPKEGEAAFRITRFSPTCTAEKVVFRNGRGWCSAATVSSSG